MICSTNVALVANGDMKKRELGIEHEINAEIRMQKHTPQSVYDIVLYIISTLT